MTALVRALAALTALGLCAVAVAQDGRIDDVSSGPIVFVVNDDDLAAAADCPGCTYAYPDPDANITFTVFRQNPNRAYTIDALHAGWEPASVLQLEARYVVSSLDGTRVLLESEWLSLSEAPLPTLVFTQASVPRENRVLVTVALRLALTGDEAAGDLATRLTHRVRETGSAAMHDVFASLPTYLRVRLVGATEAATAFGIAFDYGADPLTYLAAITTGVPLAVTASDLAWAEISTNHPNGYTVTLLIEDVIAPAGVDVGERLLLLGAPAAGRTFSSDGPTNGVVTLFEGADYALHVRGDEPPGTYAFTVRLHAIRNP
ncbi:MAG: hypothetical protein EA416_14445 [Trueperaceae bacterium]|nr:MAG: hypothetical protein EA416_14445 [Trueperaceae bacterium]